MKSRSRRVVFPAIVILLCICVGCGPEKRPRLAIAFVIDATGSIDHAAIQEALASLDPLFEKKKFQRGDSLYVIPITGDTLTESQGNILRFHLSETREVYDGDLQALAKEVKEKLEKMRLAAVTRPYSHSDVLGAAWLAAEELSFEKGDVRKKIVILSDFIQDDARYNFNTLPQLATVPSATELARKLTEQSKNSPFRDTDVFLGFLRSKDLRRQSLAKRDGLKAFWQHYFELSGAKSISWSIDGPGRLGAALESSD